jgi:hypothetical protein
MFMQSLLELFWFPLSLLAIGIFFCLTGMFYVGVVKLLVWLELIKPEDVQHWL